MQLLGQALDSVGDAGRQADAQAVSAAAGKANVVDVVTAVAESETALQTMVAVRDRDDLGLRGDHADADLAGPRPAPFPGRAEASASARRSRASIQHP